MTIVEQVRDELKQIRASYLAMVVVCIAFFLVAQDTSDELYNMGVKIHDLSELKLVLSGEQKDVSNFESQLNRFYWNDVIQPLIASSLNNYIHDELMDEKTGEFESCISKYPLVYKLPRFTSLTGSPKSLLELTIGELMDKIPDELKFFSKPIQSISFRDHNPQYFPSDILLTDLIKPFAPCENFYSLEFVTSEAGNDGYLSDKYNITLESNDEVPRHLLVNIESDNYRQDYQTPIAFFNYVLSSALDFPEQYESLTISQAIDKLTVDYEKLLLKEKSAIEIFSLSVTPSMAGKIFFWLIVFMQVVIFANMRKVRQYATPEFETIIPPSLIFAPGLIPFIYTVIMFGIIPAVSLGFVNYNLRPYRDIDEIIADSIFILFLALVNALEASKVFTPHIGIGLRIKNIANAIVQSIKR